MNTSHVVIVDSDPAAVSSLSRSFRDGGFHVSTVRNGQELNTTLESRTIDLVLMDTVLPDTDGLSLLRRIRGRSEVGVIMLGKHQDEIECIINLEMGADDYITKPFNAREVVARAKSVVRRTRLSSANAAGEGIQFGGMKLDLEKRLLENTDGETISLTRGEFDLLSILARQQGRVLSRDQLLDAISSREHTPTDRTVDNLISRIRRKIEAEPAKPVLLVTERGVGYRLLADG